jgi:thioredoxin reductase (NADPH)
MKTYDAILVGAGPCGLAAAADFKAAGLDYLHLEQGALAQTIRLFPKGIKLYSPRADLTFAGVTFPGEQDKPPGAEEYVAYLASAARQLNLKIKTYRTITHAQIEDDTVFLQATTRTGVHEEYRARNLVVATGGHYRPVLLDIPGEDLPMVSHYFRNDKPARGQRVLVLGGGNSAVEASILLAKKGAHVIWVCRCIILPRRIIKPWLLPEFDAQVAAGRIETRPGNVPVRIEPGRVWLRSCRAIEHQETVACDRVYLLTGYGPDYILLHMIGVPFNARTKRPLFSPRTLQTKEPGIFLCGTIVRHWQGEKASIANTREHGKILLEHLRK